MSDGQPGGWALPASGVTDADVIRFLGVGEAVLALSWDSGLALADAQCVVGVLATEWRPDA